MKKVMYLALLVVIMPLGDLKAMDYDQLSAWQKERAVKIKRSAEDKGLALYLPSGIDLIKKSIPECKEVILPNAEGLSEKQLLMVVSDLESSLEHSVPDCYKTGTGKITQWGYAGYHKYDNQYKSSDEILALSEEDRRKAAEEGLLKLNREVIPLNSAYNRKTALPVYITVLNAAEESALCVPEIHEVGAHRLADTFLKGTDSDTLGIWLKNDQVKQVDGLLGSLTKKSHDVVVKYMNHPKMERNNQLPVETVKQAVYLQVLQEAPDTVKQQALYTPEIRAALGEYKNAENLVKINQAYPLLQKIQAEAVKAYMQQIKERDHWSE